ncbi:MAG: hypothetical protein GTO18_12715 [Anaerolineales bacterium]|nr:hypothetical protein [Anaerolineales bacterium]
MIQDSLATGGKPSRMLPKVQWRMTQHFMRRIPSRRFVTLAPQLAAVSRITNGVFISRSLERLRNVSWRLSWSVVFIAAAFAGGCNSFPEAEITASTDLISPTLMPVQELTPYSFTVEGWNTFINDIHHYAFDYPNSAIVETVGKDTSSIQIQTGTEETLLLDALTEYLPGDVIYFLDTTSIHQRQIGSFIWFEYVLPDGYCDGPSCSPPIYGLQMEHGKILYRVTIYSQESTTEIQDMILATFRIIP